MSTVENAPIAGIMPPSLASRLADNQLQLVAKPFHNVALDVVARTHTVSRPMMTAQLRYARKSILTVLLQRIPVRSFGFGLPSVAEIAMVATPKAFTERPLRSPSMM